MSVMLIIKNNEQNIAETNFWSTKLAKEGRFFLSFNTGACRVLLPKVYLKDIRDMKKAKEVILSRGPYSGEPGLEMYEILFEDHSDYPYQMMTTVNGSDRLIPSIENGCQLPLSIWVPHSIPGRVKCAYRTTARFRIVPEIPWCKPW